MIKFRERLRWRQLCGILWHGHFSLVAALGLTIVDIVVFVRVKQGAVEGMVVGVPAASSSGGSGSGLAPLPVHSETVALVLGIFGLGLIVALFGFSIVGVVLCSQGFCFFVALLGGAVSEGRSYSLCAIHFFLPASLSACSPATSQ